MRLRPVQDHRVTRLSEVARIRTIISCAHGAGSSPSSRTIASRLPTPRRRQVCTSKILIC